MERDENLLISPCVQSSEKKRFLTPQLLEMLTSRSGKPRLNVARNMLLRKENLEDLGFRSVEDALPLGEELFSFWRDLPEFMVLWKQNIRGDKEDEFVAVKCSKRGNDVYQRRIKTRFEWLNREIPDKKFFEIRDFQVDKEVHTSLLWITLTWDTKRGSIQKAWETLGEDFNRFLCALRKRFGEISSLRVWESYESGYPHVHAVVFFSDHEFHVFPWWSEPLESNAGRGSEPSEETSLKVAGRTGATSLLPLPKEAHGKLTFRIYEKEEISSLWHSHVDVQAISSLKAVFTYIKKHQEKIILGLSGSVQEGDGVKVGFDLENIKGLRTLFLSWIFRKRSFSVSGDFREKISDLINHLHNSNMVGQMDLEENFVPEWRWIFLGVFLGSELGIPPFIWAKSLEKAEVERLLEARAWRK